MTTPIEPTNGLYRFDADSFCIVHCRENSDVVQMTSNIADAEVAEHIARSIEESGGIVLGVMPAGVLVAAMKLVKKNFRMPNLQI